MRIVIPSSVADASKEKVFLAGGTQIMRNKGESDVLPDVVADISAVVPSEISKEGEDIIIGAMATFNDLIESSLVPSYLKESAAFMASWELRNSATIGGNIASELDSVLAQFLTKYDSIISPHAMPEYRRNTTRRMLIYFIEKIKQSDECGVV